MWPFEMLGASLNAVAQNASAVVHPTHPYFPLAIEIPGYTENDWNVPTLLALFCICCSQPFALTYLLVSRLRPNLPTSELLTLLWFVLCGCIHSFFEGYYVYNFRAMGGLQDLFGQLWKEYSLSDSRYLTKDPFVLCMETITAVRMAQGTIYGAAS
jgi:cholestenol delta-isomerase